MTCRALASTLGGGPGIYHPYEDRTADQRIQLAGAHRLELKLGHHGSQLARVPQSTRLAVSREDQAPGRASRGVDHQRAGDPGPCTNETLGSTDAEAAVRATHAVPVAVGRLGHDSEVHSLHGAAPELRSYPRCSTSKPSDGGRTT